jgi:hypothetical protein
VDDVSVFLEHVDLLDGLDGLHVHLLQGGLELLVVGTGGLVDLLDLAAGSALASVLGNIISSVVSFLLFFLVFHGRGMLLDLVLLNGLEGKREICRDLFPFLFRGVRMETVPGEI